MKPIQPPKDWRERSELLTVQEVIFITKFSYWFILELVRTGKLAASLNSRPYKFDPAEIVRVFFTPTPKPASDRSLKTKDPITTSHKPVTKEDLWL